MNELIYEPYFTAAEFRCPCGAPQCETPPPSPLLLQILNEARRRIGTPIIVTSGCRCKAHNAAVGGVANSYHLRGMAADIYAQGVSVWRLAATLNELAWVSCIIVYSQQGFVHIDVRREHVRLCY